MAKMKHFFPHDASASRDGKILEMKMEFGAKGYGVYWEILEYLFEQGGTTKYNPRLIAIAIHEDVRFVKRFLSSCIEDYKLFDTDGTYFWSKRLRSELDRIKDISIKNSNNVSKRYESEKSYSKCEKELEVKKTINDSYDRRTTVEGSYNDRTTIDKTRRDNARKNVEEQKNSTGIYGEFHNVFLDETEYSKLVEQLGSSKATEWIERLSSYKASMGKKYKSDYATIKNWIRKEAREAEQGHVASSNKGGAQILTFQPKPAVSIWDEEEAQA